MFGYFQGFHESLSFLNRKAHFGFQTFYRYDTHWPFNQILFILKNALTWVFMKTLLLRTYLFEIFFGYSWVLKYCHGVWFRIMSSFLFQQNRAWITSSNFEVLTLTFINKFFIIFFFLIFLFVFQKEKQNINAQESRKEAAKFNKIAQFWAYYEKQR